MFQRGYCWGEGQLEGWWAAVTQGLAEQGEGEQGQGEQDAGVEEQGSILEELAKEEEDTGPFHSCGIGRC